MNDVYRLNQRVVDVLPHREEDTVAIYPIRLIVMLNVELDPAERSTLDEVLRPNWITRSNNEAS